MLLFGLYLLENDDDRNGFVHSVILSRITAHDQLLSACEGFLNKSI